MGHNFMALHLAPTLAGVWIMPLLPIKSKKERDENERHGEKPKGV